MVQLTRRALYATIAGIALLSDGLIAVGSSRAQRSPTAPEGGEEGSTGPRDPGAEQFVQSHGRKLMSMLGDTSLDEARRVAAYRAALEQTIDLRTISDSLLGKYSSKLSAEQRARFTDAFVGYARRITAYWLKKYRADHFQIRGSHVERPGDAIVDIAISSPSATEPKRISFRVSGTGDERRIIDLRYKGAWLRAVQRDEFVSTLDKANGDVDVLIARLNELPKGPRY